MTEQSSAEFRQERLGANVSSIVQDLTSLSLAGLSAMHRGTGTDFVQTIRGIRGDRGAVLLSEGDNLRYAAIVALGLNFVSAQDQKQTLDGKTLTQLVDSIVDRAEKHEDPGAIALTAWAAAEIDGRYEKLLFDRWVEILSSGKPIPTVDISWAITAAVAARALGDTTAVLDLAASRLLDAQGPRGIFPHMLPAGALRRWRAHVGCFADQVYPIQAFARLAAASAEQKFMDAANLCAARICALQGAAGQWWWHYDVRDGTVVEGFPVYSVHQHAMAPMALFDLSDAGGNDHRDAIELGLRWMETHPEVIEELISPTHQLIWRKVGRREPPKAVRSLSAVGTSLRPGLHLPGLQTLFPPNKVDYECRPYELGWLLYAWNATGVVPNQATKTARHG